MSHLYRPAILFLLVNNMSSGGSSGTGGGSTSRSGLLNSATLTADQITKYLHYTTVVEVVPDARSISAAIDKNKPGIVIFEAIWVTPKEVKALTEKYFDIIFVTRVHSEIPFLAHENNAIKYLKELTGIKNSFISFNSFETEREIFTLGWNPIYLPNIYCDVFDAEICPPKPECGTLNFGCFGSIRPFKNHLMQSLAAILYGKIHKQKVRFHINATRVEQQGGCALGNMRAFFDGTDNELVEHSWLDRKEFLELVGEMDLGMQLSFNESFNIISADFCLKGIPIIVSDAIDWMPKESRASVDKMDDILSKMNYALRKKHRVVRDNISALDKHNTISLRSWNEFLESI